MIVLLSITAYALTTPQTCDRDVKYYCAYVEYTDNGSYVDVQNRWYRGAIDGGAKKWQRFWMADWWWNGSQWQLVRSFGEGPWYTNVTFEAWHAIGLGTISQPAAVNLRIRYEECIPGNCPYNWCSPQLDHYLYNGTSAQVGGGTC